MYYENAEDMLNDLITKHRFSCYSLNISDHSNDLQIVFECDCGAEWEISVDSLKDSRWYDILSDGLRRDSFCKKMNKGPSKKELEKQEEINSAKAYKHLAVNSKNKEDLVKYGRIFQKKIMKSLEK